MMLDDVYGSDFDRFPLEQEAAWSDSIPPELEWDESEAMALVEQIVCRHAMTD